MEEGQEMAILGEGIYHHEKTVNIPRAGQSQSGAVPQWCAKQRQELAEVEEDQATDFDQA